MRNYNPYLLLYLIPIALVAAAIYYTFSIRSSLNILSTTFIIAVMVFSILFMLRNIQKSNISGYILQEQDSLEAVLRKIIKLKNADLSEAEIEALVQDARGIYATASSRSERTMKLKILVDKYLDKESNTYNGDNS